VVAIYKIGQQDSPARTIGTPLSSDDIEIMPVAASFNPNGSVIATSTEGHSVTMWNFSSGKPIPPALYGHTAAVSGLTFRQDGKVLASGSADGSIRLWDVQAHELIGTFNPLKSDTNQTNHIIFAPNAGILVSPGEDDSILLWDVDFEDWTHLACRIANRNLTAKEWSTYFGSSRYQKTCGDI
jgi:WD40 repeat protein